MNKAKLNWWWNGAGYDSAITAVMARWTALGYTHPSGAVLTSLNTLIGDLKTAGVYTGFDIFYVPMLGDDTLVQTTGAINYITPASYQITFPVAPTSTDSGFEGNGSSQYASTNFNPATNGVNYTLNNCSRGLYKYKADGVNTSIDGQVGQTTNVLIDAASGTLNRINGNSVAAGVATTALDYIAINRDNSLTVSVYTGTTKQDRNATSISVPSAAFSILRSNFGYGGQGISMYYAGRAFSQAEHAAIRTAFLAHKSRLGL